MGGPIRSSRVVFRQHGAKAQLVKRTSDGSRTECGAWEEQKMERTRLAGDGHRASSWIGRVLEGTPERHVGRRACEEARSGKVAEEEQEMTFDAVPHTGGASWEVLEFLAAWRRERVL